MLLQRIGFVSALVLFLGTGLLWVGLHVVRPAHAATSVVLSAIGQQVGTLSIPSSDQYVGGGFSMVTTADTTITKIEIRERGNSTDSDTSNVRLFFGLDTTSPYDCASETYSLSGDAFGFATSFSVAKASFTGSIDIGPSQAACFYVVLDVQNTAGNGETLEIEMAPGNQIVSGDFIVVSSDSERPNDNEKIVGTTVFVLPPPSVVSVAAVGTQIATLVSPSEDQYLGGSFKMIPDTGSTSIKQVTIKEGGTISASANLSQARLFYDLDTSSPYDCASEVYDGDEPEYGSATSFNSTQKATFVGLVSITPTQAVCFYTVVDVESSASDGASIEILIDDPTNDVVVEVGASVLASNEVALSGTTLIEESPELSVIVSAAGSQIPLLAYPSTNQYLGGTFRITAQTGTPLMTKITIAFSGSFNATDIGTVGLYYDFDTSSPYDCTSEAFDGDEMLYGVLVDPKSSKTVVFTGSAEVSALQAMCIYPVVNMVDGDDGDTLEIKMPRPNRNTIASGGVAVVPSTDVELTGVTILSSLAEPAPDNIIISDGDLIRTAGDHRVFIVRISGAKKFIRHIVDSAVFDFYGHFSFAAVKDVASLDAYRLSAWVRLPLVVGDTESEKIYEVNDDPGPGGSKHWITCATPTTCESTWRSRGGDPDGVYTINGAEMNYYVTGPNVFLQ